MRVEERSMLNLKLVKALYTYLAQIMHLIWIILRICVNKFDLRPHKDLH